jgi:phosphoribosylglycinamide formyltransferase 1
MDEHGRTDPMAKDRPPEAAGVQPPARIGILASGRGSNLQALIDAREEGNLLPALAVVVSDRPEAQALERARRHGLPAIYLDPGSPRARLTAPAEEAIVACLRGHGVDWVILAGYFRIIGPVLLRAFPDRILNIHPSLLPSFPGLHAQKQALDYGVKVAGCTVHLVNASVDAGPILMQASVPVLPADDEESLAARILREEHRLLVEAVNRVVREGFQLRGRVVLWGREENP